MLAALGPALMRLAGSIADGVVLAMAAADRVPDLLADFYAGAAGRDAELDVILAVPVLLNESDPSYASVRANIAEYGVIDAYNRHLARQGFDLEAAALREAWAARSREQALAAVSDRLLRALCIQSNQAECVEQLAKYRAAGVKTLLINPIVDAADGAEGHRKILEVLSAFVEC